MMRQVTGQVLYLVDCALSLDWDVLKDRKCLTQLYIPSPELGICHSTGAHHMLHSISFSTIFSLSLSPSLSFSLSLPQHLFLSLSLPSSFLSLGSTRVPYQSCMRLSWPACFILSLLRIISGLYVRTTLASAVDLFAHGLRYGHSLHHFSSLPWIIVTCTNTCHYYFLGSPRFTSSEVTSSNGLFGR